MRSLYKKIQPKKGGEPSPKELLLLERISKENERKSVRYSRKIIRRTDTEAKVKESSEKDLHAVLYVAERSKKMRTEEECIGLNDKDQHQ